MTPRLPTEEEVAREVGNWCCHGEMAPEAPDRIRADREAVRLAAFEEAAVVVDRWRGEHGWHNCDLFGHQESIADAIRRLMAEGGDKGEG